MFKLETISFQTGQPLADEEQMGDIISLVDSIQEDYLPPIPLKYKNMPPEPLEPKVGKLFTSSCLRYIESYIIFNLAKHS